MKNPATLLSYSLLAYTLTFAAHDEGAPSAEIAKDYDILESLDIAPVWAAHPVGFALLTQAPHQFVAFYDAKRRLTLATRRLGENKWSFNLLPITTAWDSHNYVTMTIDDEGLIHLTADMHATPLNYFRTTRPLDPSSFEKIAGMTGELEDKVTYPQFFRGPGHELIFTYRHGFSGNGKNIFNVYEPSTKSWRRMLDQPLFDGEGKRNAYFEGPLPGPDGWLHISWVWRDTPDAVTNHDLGYARSKDLLNWENARGEPLPLPITFSPKTVVDPVPVNGGIINGNTRIGFDARNRVTISYHKYDQAGILQPWNARLENGEWKLYQTTRWNTEVKFGGRGSLGFPVNLGPVQSTVSGHVFQAWKHPEGGRGTWLLDPETLVATDTLAISPLPAALAKPEGTFEGLGPKMVEDLGVSDRPGVRYILRWETLPPNRDTYRKPPYPEPSMLRVYAVSAIGDIQSTGRARSTSSF